jgi:hypothetical protein
MAQLLGNAATAVGVCVPCTYCRAPMPADTFVFWSNAKRLLSADCRECQRRVTIAATTWRRWTGVDSPPTS